MTTITEGNSEIVTVSAGTTLSVSAPGDARVQLLTSQPGACYSSFRQTGADRIYGPYSLDTLLDITATAGDVEHIAQTAAAATSIMLSADLPFDEDGRPEGTVWIVPGGAIYVKDSGAYTVCVFV